MDFKIEYVEIKEPIFHKIAVHNFQPKSGYDETVVCVHGLTRNASEFHRLAEHLVKTKNYRVLCIDVVGRGKSTWISKEHYNYPQYIGDACGVIQHYQLKEFHWIGTSMGGILGIFMSSMVLPIEFKIKSMVLNDIGAFVSKEALTHIAKYTTEVPLFKSAEEACESLKTRWASMGIMSDEAWMYIAKNGIVPSTEHPDMFQLSYDPNVVHMFKDICKSGEWDKIEPFNLWAYFNSIHCDKIFVMRGEKSDVLMQSTLDSMLSNTNSEEGVVHEGIKLLSIPESKIPISSKVYPDCGHVPNLQVEEHWEDIEKFL
eukprot:TRINITY_DN3927_c0_g2_i1.p1 TRINITY_DN3927_c0_g2~~TRINITY_DN3927_c0_g2_i1.p1  ORF type:complete len:315 (+),score=78.32 TRINITY_DN3927_c0_g2_i1:170-1114(+)